MESFIKGFIEEVQTTLAMLPTVDIAKGLNALQATYERDGRIYVFGNGGSLSLATHWVSDFNKTVMPQYGVLNPDMIGLKGIAKRSVFVIDKSGVVRHQEVLEDARNEPDYGKIKQALASL
jgi:uncharacterized phosphosugar-binding protein